MKTALFSVSYAGLWGQDFLDPVQCIRKAAILGYSGVLLMAKAPHVDPQSISDSELALIHSELARCKVELTGLAAYNDFTLPSPAEVPINRMQVGYIRSCCKVTAALGGGLVRVFTGYSYGEHSPASARTRIINLLRECGDIAAGYNVDIAVQNHHDIAVDTADMRLLLDEVNHPNIRSGYDAWSPFLRDEDILKGAESMADISAMTIVANYRQYPRYRYYPEHVNYMREYPDSVRAVSIDEGEIDYRAFLRSLASKGFDGWIVYEMCSPIIGGGNMENLDAYASKFIQFVKDSV